MPSLEAVFTTATPAGMKMGLGLFPPTRDQGPRGLKWVGSLALGPGTGLGLIDLEADQCLLYSPSCPWLGVQ